jgi:hypothetical protein
MTGFEKRGESSEMKRRAVSELIPGRLEPKVEGTKKSDPMRLVSDPDIFLLTSLVIYDEPDERRA